MRRVATVVAMLRPRFHLLLSRSARSTKLIVLTLVMFSIVRSMAAQDTPLLSGGVGFFTATNAGQTTYSPEFEPLLAAPIGPRLLIESRAILLESFAPNGDGRPGYDHSHFISLTYLQGDYTLSSHITCLLYTSPSPRD